MPSSRKINLEKVQVSLDKVCPKCGALTSPAEVRRIDFERIECPCAENSFAQDKSRLGLAKTAKSFISHHRNILHSEAEKERERYVSFPHPFSVIHQPIRVQNTMASTSTHSIVSIIKHPPSKWCHQRAGIYNGSLVPCDALLSV